MNVGDRVTYKGTDGPSGEVTDVSGDEVIVRWGVAEGKALTSSHRSVELQLGVAPTPPNHLDRTVTPEE